MKVDGHVHLWDSRAIPGELPYPLPVDVASGDDLLRDMAANNIDYAVLVQPTPHGGDHSLLVSALERYPDRFVGIGLLESGIRDSDAQVKHICKVADMGLSGIRVHPIDKQSVDIGRIAREAHRRELLLELHVDESTWETVFRALDAAPDTLIVVDHFGRPRDPMSSSAREFIQLLSERANVAVKVAAIDLIWGATYPYQNFRTWIRFAMDTLGPERLFWGSNFPWSRGEQYSASLREIEAEWGLNNSELDALFGGTASRIFGFDYRSDK